MKIVVTGGAGFIGSHFIKYLLKEYPDYKVLNIDKLTYAGNLENLKEVEKNPNYKFLKVDICNRDMEDVVDGYDVIINFAAESHVDRSIQEPEAFLKTDIMGTFNLLEISRKKGIHRYIQISTDEVYGSADEGYPFSEESPLNPSSPYSASKASADLLVLSYYKTYKTPGIIIRSTNNYGPNQYPEKFIPLFITNAIEDKPLPLYGDGKNIRDWLFVRDNCRAIDIILHKGKTGIIYNVAAEQERENIFIARKILEYLGKPESLIKFVPDRPGHDRRYSISCERIKELGWEPEVPFEEGLRITIEWYKNNEMWWKKIKSGEFLEYYRRQYKL
ncbi:MAG: dTDP-glucose 4,6-dehydratase [Candidatus Omnitrophica bacterium]|nr:dTDP-glucose 4,6-dehydratase [Candidatus Omnitrophota bacterium]